MGFVNSLSKRTQCAGHLIGGTGTAGLEAQAQGWLRGCYAQELEKAAHEE